MAIHYRTQGFFIKKEDRGEADQLFTIYTEDFGKLEILGKAIRKIKSKLRSGAELFYLSEIEFIQGKTHKTLTDAILIDKWENIRKDLKKLKIVYKISEVLEKLVKGSEKDEKLWKLLIKTITKLNNCLLFTVNCFLIYYYFFWNLLSVLGYKPELYHCAICQKKLNPEKLFFSIREGGIICNFCRKSVKLTKEIKPETIKIIRIFLEKDISILDRLKIEKKDINNLKTISDYCFSEIISSIK